MSELTIVGRAQAKVIALQKQKNVSPIAILFSRYDEKTNETFLCFLDDVIREYQRSQAWQYLPLKDKVEAEVKAQMLKELIRNIQR